MHRIVLLPSSLRRVLYRWRLAGAVLVGRFGTFLGQIERADGSPLSLGYVWGVPIKVTQQSPPSPEYVAAVHEEFCREIVRIFDQYKGRFGYDEDETLELVSAKADAHRPKEKGQ